MSLTECTQGVRLLINNTSKVLKNPLLFDVQIGKRAFGVEIESIISRSDKYQQHSDILHSLNLTDSSWNVIEDLSLDTDFKYAPNKTKTDPFMKCEFVSPKLEYNNKTMRSLENLCTNLQYKVNANINQSCGFHIHFDTEDLTINDIIKIAVNYSCFEQVIDLFMNKSRRNNVNKWVKSIRVPVYNNINTLCDVLENPNYNKTSLSVLDMINPSRKCHKYNFTNVFYYNLNKIGMGMKLNNSKENDNENKTVSYINTIENRHHHSTFNYYDMLNWIRFNLLFIHYSINKPLILKQFIKNANEMQNEMVYINPIDVITQFDILGDFIDNDEIMDYYQQKI